MAVAQHLPYYLCEFTGHNGPDHDDVLFDGITESIPYIQAPVPYGNLFDLLQWKGGQIFVIFRIKGWADNAEYRDSRPGPAATSTTSGNDSAFVLQS